MRIAIIGAGIAGLTLANELKNLAEVIIFEKARGVGGRCATRFADPYYFDHGAQCFTARTAKFQNYITQFRKQNLIYEWRGRVVNLELGKAITERLWHETHLVFAPNMNSFCKNLAQTAKISLNTEVAPLTKRQQGKWQLFNIHGEELSEYDLVISTAPAVQTQKLFTNLIAPEEALFSAEMQSVYALMLGFKGKLALDFIAAKVRNNPIKWISVNSSKPGRNQDNTSLVLHSKNNWAEKNIEAEISWVENFLLNEFQKVTGISTREVDYVATHRWRYALVKNAKKQGPYLNINDGIAAVSDWCHTSRIEEVWLESMKLLETIKEIL